MGGIVLGSLMAFGLTYDFFVRQNFKSSKSTASLIGAVYPGSDSRRGDIEARRIDSGKVDSAGQQMSGQSTGF